MKKMTLTLGLLSLLALNAAAQDEPAPGDRIEVTFPSGGSVMGTVVAPAKGAPAASVTLDLSSEYPGLRGTLTVPKRDLRSVRKLRILKDARPCDLTSPPQVQEPVKPAPPPPAVATPEPSKPVPPPDEKAAEELRKASELFSKFPPPDWSPERYNMIRVKQFRGQLPTPMEREFAQGYELWVKGRDAANKK